MKKNFNELIEQIELLKDIKISDVKGGYISDETFPENLRELLKEIIYVMIGQNERIIELEKIFIDIKKRLVKLEGQPNKTDDLKLKQNDIDKLREKVKNNPDILDRMRELNKKNEKYF